MEESKSKAFLHTLGAAVWVPLVQAVWTAVIVMVAVALLMLSFDVRKWQPWTIGSGVIALVWMWRKSMNHWFKLTDIERMTGILNGDGKIGEGVPEQPVVTQTIKVTLNRISQDGHFSGEYFDLPCSPGQLKELADGLLNGAPFTEREWAGAGRPFSSDAFRGLRKEFLRRGLIELASEKDARQGYVLTDDGSQFMADILEKAKGE